MRISLLGIVIHGPMTRPDKDHGLLSRAGLSCVTFRTDALVRRVEERLTRTVVVGLGLGAERANAEQVDTLTRYGSKGGLVYVEGENVTARNLRDAYPGYDSNHFIADELLSSVPDAWEADFRDHPLSAVRSRAWVEMALESPEAARPLLEQWPRSIVLDDDMLASLCASPAPETRALGTMAAARHGRRR